MTTIIQSGKVYTCNCCGYRYFYEEFLTNFKVFCPRCKEEGKISEDGFSESNIHGLTLKILTNKKALIFDEYDEYFR